MTNKMQELETALTNAGANVTPNVTGSQTIFANGFGIFATLTGNVQARNLYDKDERFTLGKVSDSAEDLAKEFMYGYKNPWG